MALGLIGKLTVMFGADFKGFDKSMKQAQKKLSKWSRSANQIGNQLTQNLTFPILAIGAGAVKFASDFEESLNKVRVSFGSSSKSVEDFAKTTLTNFNIAEGSALEMASLFGDMGTSMGMTEQKAADMSKELVGLAGDLASFKNIQIDVAQTALKAIFTGETEALKNLGVIVTDTVLKQTDYFKSLNKTWNQLTQLEKIQIRFNEVLRQTEKAQGDVVKTSDSVANSTRNLQQSVKELGEQFGKELLPLASDVINTLRGVVDRMRSMSTENKKLAINIALVTAAFGPLFKAAAAFLNVIKNLSIFIPKLLKFITGPIGLIVGFTAMFIKLDEGDGIVSNLKKKFVELKTAIFGVSEEAKKLDFSVMDNNSKTDPKSILDRMMSGNVPFTNKPSPKTTKKTTPESNRTDVTIEKLETLKAQLLDTGRAWKTYYSDIAESSTMAQEAQQNWTDAIAYFESVFTSAMTSAAYSQEGFFKSLIQNLKQAVKQMLIQLAVVTAIKLMLGGGKLSLKDAFASGLKETFNLSNVPALSSGGIVTGPQLALIGEGNESEAVIPLSKLDSMLNNNSSGGGSKIEVFGRISGNDIFISNQKSTNSRFRSV